MSSHLALEQKQESIDHESTYYIQEIKDSWNHVNQILPEEFENKKPTSLNPSFTDEIWIKTTSESMELNWIADIGSPKSFINEETAKLILRTFKKAKQFLYNQNPSKYRCFNNVSNPKSEVIRMNLSSGPPTANGNNILIVEMRTVNLLGLSKLGF